MFKLYAAIASLTLGSVLIAIGRSIFLECQARLVGVTFVFPSDCTPTFILLGDMVTSIVGSILATIGLISVFFAVLKHLQKHQINI